MKPNSTPEAAASNTSIVTIVTTLALDAVSAASELSQEVSLRGRAALARLYDLRLDLALAFLLGVAGAAFSLWLFQRLDFDFVVGNSGDLWFGTDSQRVMHGNTYGWSSAHWRSSVHTLWPMFVSAPFIVLQSLGLSHRAAAALLIALGAFAFIGMLYGAARVVGLRRAEASGVVALATSTAATMFVMSVPETYALGSASMLVTILWLGSPRGAHDRWSAPLQSLLSLSMTVTNWMAGLASAVIGLGLRRGLAVSATAFLIASVFIVVEQNIFVNAGKLLALEHEAQFLDGFQTSTAQRLASLLAQPLVAPEPTILQLSSVRPLIGFAHPVQLNSPLAITALAGWLLLVSLGVLAAVKGRVSPPIVLMVSLVLAGQLILHTFYGYWQETFLYSLHFMPFVVLIAGWAFLVHRWLAWGLLVLTLSTTALNNLQQFERAAIMLAPVGAAHVALGQMFLNGDNDLEDYSETLRELAPLAARGAPEAQLRLGYMYMNGLGVEQNSAEALRLWTLAAEQEMGPRDWDEVEEVPARNMADVLRIRTPEGSRAIAAARSGLGLMYLEGNGVAPDREKGLRLLREAAQNGDPVALSALRERGLWY